MARRSWLERWTRRKPRAGGAKDASRDGPEPAASQGRARGATVIVRVGTYEYMAPEQFRSAHEVDARADLFALGVCLYEMLCGQRPYAIAAGARQEAPEPSALRGGEALPKGLCDLLRHLVAWEPEGRPQSAAEVREELCGIYEALFQEPSSWSKLPEVSLEADGWRRLRMLEGHSDRYTAGWRSPATSFVGYRPTGTGDVI